MSWMTKKTFLNEAERHEWQYYIIMYMLAAGRFIAILIVW